LKFAKTRDVQSPSRGTKKSAGIDFYVPKATKEFIDKLTSMNKESLIMYETYKDNFRIRPFSNILFPLGIKVNVPKDYALIFFNKSGISSKKGLIIGACVVDEDYQGELFLNLINTTDDVVSIEFDKKIVQGILIKMNYINMSEVEETELYSHDSERGIGGFGSTGL